MDAEILEQDNERDDKILMNLTGTALYFIGMNLPDAAWVDVE